MRQARQRLPRRRHRPVHGRTELGREPGNSELTTDVRCGAHSELGSDITALPESANSKNVIRLKQNGASLSGSVWEKSLHSYRLTDIEAHQVLTYLQWAIISPSGFGKEFANGGWGDFFAGQEDHVRVRGEFRSSPREYRTSFACGGVVGLSSQTKCNTSCWRCCHGAELRAAFP